MSETRELLSNGLVTAVADTPNSLHLELEIEDPIIIEYLNDFDGILREDKAIEALRVGVVAIQSASPALDTKIVEEKFRELDDSVKKCLDDFSNDLSGNLEEHFQPGSGSVPRSIDSFFGDNGSLSRLLEDYFGQESGKVSQILEKQLGPSSQFAKSLDPNDKESVISRIEDAVKLHLQEKVNEIVNEFSLDDDGTALSRLRTSISKEIKTIEETNNAFFVELREALGIEKGKKIEAEKGTEKGREFELSLYDRVASLGRQLGDTTENVRGQVGSIPRRKVGDYVICLGETCSAPGRRIVVEVKKEQGYKLRNATDELKDAKENRDADVGIFVFAKGYEPPEVGDFHRIGNDFYITVDEEAVTKNQPILYFEAAYKILRTIIVTAVRKEAEDELDLNKMRSEVDALIELVERFSDLSTKARTIKSSSEHILSTVDDMKDEMEERLDTLVHLIGS
jgi:hypothetical protein